MDGHIFIYGYISPYQDSDPGMYGEVNLKDVQNQIQNQAAADTLVVHINSMGGDVDEGFGIHDVLRATGKTIITQIEGMCASIATVISLAGDKRKITENSEFMIHCPMMWGGGTADDFKAQADLIQKTEDKVLDFYVQKTDGDREAISAMMKDETYLTSDQAKNLGFITEVITTMKAVARINIKKDTMAKMTQEDFDKKFKENETGIVAKIMAAIKGATTPNAKMLTVTVADGTILDFGDAIQEEGEVVVGTVATVDGTPAEGEYVLTDGRTLVFAAGAVTEIKEAEGDEDVEALKAQITEKDAEIATLKAAQAKVEKDQATMEAKMAETIAETVKAEMITLKASIKSDIGKEGIDMRSTTATGEKESRKLMKDK